MLTPMPETARPENRQENVTESGREYVLSEVQNAELGRAFALIAYLSPGLGEAELKVLICLTRRFAPNPSAIGIKGGQVSSRKLAEETKLARPNVLKALNSLSGRNIIAIRPGTATEPATYYLTYLRVARMGGIETIPPLALSQDQGGPFSIPPLALSQDQGGPFSIPPPALSQDQGGLFSIPPPTLFDGQPGPAGARVDRSIEKPPEEKDRSMFILDKVLKAKPSHFHQSDLAEARSWMYGFMVKKAPLDAQNPHPPDDVTLAQYLTAAGGQAVTLIQKLLTENHKAPLSPQWFVTCALHRIHGISSDETKARRAELRIEPKRHKALTGKQQQFPAPEEKTLSETQNHDPDFARELMTAALSGKCEFCKGSGVAGQGAGKSRCGGCLGTGKAPALLTKKASGA
jgi:DNA-binding MarR family transcriptional regulator